jgi:cathepsin X
VEKMKAELFLNGPISCGIQATEKFETTYKGGIFKEYYAEPEINHEISIVGWGTEESTGEEFWVGRNSWGTYWGENGFFRMKMGGDNLAIETDCTAATPSFHKHYTAEEEAYEKSYAWLLIR